MDDLKGSARYFGRPSSSHPRLFSWPYWRVATRHKPPPAFEPQNQPLDGRQGRLYLIRHSSVMSGYGAPPMKANGKLVGELAAGTYFVVDRPPGTHKITVYGIRDTIGCETDVSFQPGMSHYFELGPIVRTNMEGFIADSMGVTGRPVPCRSGSSSQFMFYSLDSAAGAAAIAKLKERKS